MSRHERPLEGVSAHFEIPPVLAGGDLEILGLMPNSSNYTLLARATGEGTEALAIYKPRRGETPLWDFPEGTLCRREVAAFVVARALGWPRVPPTVLRGGPEGEGSVQLFVEFEPQQHYFTLLDARAEEFRRVALFDLIVNNADRKAGHCLLGADGIVYLIDHGVCFSADPKLRTVIWDFIGEPVDAGARADIERLTRELTGGGVHDELAALLDHEELAALAERVREVAALQAFPERGPGRPYPWPVV